MQKLPVSWDCSSIQQFSPYLCVMQSFGKREYLSSFFIPAQAGIFSPAEDDVVNARSLGAWESVVISAASSCSILARMRMVEQPRENML